ncbi:hypothetical protein BDE36_0384 [Arcticibacter tournemirensis]|nr:hypothetical protein BDE36_0384 [Arcticibacter tournemirensis]
MISSIHSITIDILGPELWVYLQKIIPFTKRVDPIFFPFSGYLNYATTKLLKDLRALVSIFELKELGRYEIIQIRVISMSTFSF